MIIATMIKTTNTYCMISAGVVLRLFVFLIALARSRSCLRCSCVRTQPRLSLVSLGIVMGLDGY